MPSWLVPLLGPVAAAPVYPTESHGFAAYVVGGFGILAVLTLFMVWTSRKPKSRRRR